MTKEKRQTIKTADFEHEFGKLIEDINSMNYATKTAFLSLVKGFRNNLIKYEPREEIEIPRFLEVR